MSGSQRHRKVLQGSYKWCLLSGNYTRQLKIPPFVNDVPIDSKQLTVDVPGLMTPLRPLNASFSNFFDSSRARARAMVPPSIVVALQVESTFEVGHRQLKGLGWGETVGQGPPNKNGCPTLRNPAPPWTGWKFRNNGMCTIYQLVISLAHPQYETLGL